MDANLKKLKNIKKLTEYMREAGILSLKDGDLEIKLAPAAVFPDKPHTAQEESKVESDQTFTDEDVLFWSAPGAEPKEAH